MLTVIELVLAWMLLTDFTNMPIRLTGRPLQTSPIAATSFLTKRISISSSIYKRTNRLGNNSITTWLAIIRADPLGWILISTRLID